MLDRRVRRGDDVKGLKKSGIFYTEIGILNVKSLNLGPWLYIIGLLIWVKGLLHWHSPHINLFSRRKKLVGFKRKNSLIIYFYIYDSLDSTRGSTVCINMWGEKNSL